MVNLTFKNDELIFILDAIIFKNLSTRLDFNLAEIIMKKLTKKLKNEQLVEVYLNNFYDINQKWKLDN